MKRRPFIKLLGSNLMGLPLVMGSASIFERQTNWGPWLAHLQQNAQVESINEIWMANGLPTEPVSVRSGEFSKASSRVFFYQKRQYCFRVFEKQHSLAGTLELLVPFWKKQGNGSWVQIACLSAYGLEALTKASQSGFTLTQVLPIEAGDAGNYQSALGTVNIKTTIQMDARVQTGVQISKQNQNIWQENFISAQKLTTNSF